MESENRAVSEGWTKEANKDKINRWSSKGITLIDEELKTLFQREYEAEYKKKMRQVCPLHMAADLRRS
jgi:hypothetical protein